VDPIEVGGLVVRREVVTHILLGDAHVIEHDGKPITTMSVIDWEAPTRIPTIAEPRNLPRGSGTLLLNEIARRAREAGVPALRYAGPYPTMELYTALRRSFRTAGTDEEFTEDVLERAVRLARDEVPVDFRPAPFERHAMPYGFADLRDGSLDRVLVDGVVYDRDGGRGSLARLDRTDTTWSAILAVAPRPPYSTTATLDLRGDMSDGPHPIPALADREVVGQAFPIDLREALAELIELEVSPPMAGDVRRVVSERELVWADLGWRTAVPNDTGFAVHAALWSHLGRHDLPMFVRRLASELGFVVERAILGEVIASLSR
jgi:hypothetical protein